MKTSAYRHFFWLAGALLLLLCGALLTRHDAFWITDGGNKFLVVRNLVDTGSAAMLPTAPTLDPEGRFFPDGIFHFQRIKGAIRSVFPDIFPRLSAPFFRGFGMPGLFVLPLLGGMGMLALFALWLRRRRYPDWLLLVLAAGTPLGFYSWTFWEMTLGAAAGFGVLLLLERRRLFWAGLLLGGSLWLRSEGYFLLIALLGALGAGREWRGALRVAAGWGCAALPLWIYNMLDSGYLLGVNGALYYLHNAQAQSLWMVVLARLGNYPYYWGSFAPDGNGLWYLLLALALLLGGFRRFEAARRLKMALAVSGLVIWCVLAGRNMAAAEPVLETIFSVGLFAAQPFLLLLALNWRPGWRHGGVALRVAMLYCLVVPPLLTTSDLGIIWGPRHFLAVLPLLLAASWYAARRLRALPLFVLLLLAAAGWQLHGYRTLTLMKENSARLTAGLREATAPVVVSDVYFLPMQTPQLLPDKEWLFVRDDAALTALLSHLKVQRVGNFSLVVSREDRYRRISNAALQKFLREVEITGPPLLIELDGTSFLNVAVFPCRFRTGDGR